jgi:hypothetical protein
MIHKLVLDTRYELVLRSIYDCMLYSQSTGQRLHR